VITLAEHFALEDEPAVFELDSQLGERGEQMAMDGGRELERPSTTVFSHRAHDIGGRTLTEEKESASTTMDLPAPVRR